MVHKQFLGLGALVYWSHTDRTYFNKEQKQNKKFTSQLEKSERLKDAFIYLFIFLMGLRRNEFAL